MFPFRLGIAVPCRGSRQGAWQWRCPSDLQSEAFKTTLERDLEELRQRGLIHASRARKGPGVGVVREIER